MYTAEEFSEKFNGAMRGLGDRTWNLEFKSYDPEDLLPSLRMSAMGDCARKLYYGLVSPLAGSSPNSWQTIIGYAGQQIVASVLRGMGYRLTDEEERVELKVSDHLRIPGHVDGLLMGLDLGSRTAVWDCKIRNSFALRNILAYGLPGGDPGMYIQQQGYLAATGADLGVVTVHPFDLSDARSRLKQSKMGELDVLANRVVLRPDPEAHEIISDRAAEITLCADAKIVPNREYDPMRANFPCPYCPWLQRCLSDGDVDQFVVTPVPWEEAA